MTSLLVSGTDYTELSKDDYDTFIQNPYTNNDKVSEKIKVSLYLHQKTMVEACLRVENEIDIDATKKINTRIAVIGDVVGAGKSLSVLSLIASNPRPRDQPIIEWGNKYMRRVIKDPKIYNVNVIVVPHTIVIQWINYIVDQTNFDCKIIQVSKEVTVLEEYVKKNDNFGCEILLVSSKIYKNNTKTKTFYDTFEDYVFSRMIVDECDSIDIPNFIPLKSSFYWLVTSSLDSLKIVTGQKLINGIIKKGIKCSGFVKDFAADMYIHAHPLSKDVNYRIILKNNDDCVRDSLQIKPYILKIINCKNTSLINVLQGSIARNVMDKLLGDDISGAVEELGYQVTDDVNVILLVTEDLQKELKELNEKLEKAKEKEYSSKKAKELSLENYEKKIDHTQEKIDNIDRRIKETDVDPITYDDITNPVVTRCCKNKFDLIPLTTYISTKSDPKCIYCKTPMTKDSIIVIDTKKSEIKEEKKKKFITEEHNKIDNLKHLIKKIIKRQHKVLIFASYDGSFTDVEILLNEMKLEHKMLKGSSKTIDKLVTNYKDEDSSLNVLLLNSQYCGAGLNLENSTDVILYHKMASDLEMQTIGRAYRPGRTCDLNVWKLHYENE